MFIFTAKVNKKWAVAAVIGLGVLLCAAVLIVSLNGGKTAEATGSVPEVKTNEDRIAYLQSFGWEVSEEPMEEQTVLIPREFTDVYEEYNCLQLSQGFDLTKYAGREAKRYTYSVKNYPSGDDTVVADIIVYKNKVIGGDIQSTAIDGFMSGFEMPGE